MNIQALMKQVQKVQADAQKVQADLEASEVEGSSGGGSVKVALTGGYKIKSVEIAADLAATGDREMIEDAVKAALEDALGKVSAMTKEAMSKAMGGMAIPGMPFPF